jgi:hypothetical protein
MTRVVPSLKITDGRQIIQQLSIQIILDAKMKQILKPIDICESVNSAVVQYASPSHCVFSFLSKSFSPFPSSFSNHLQSTFSLVMSHRHALHFTMITRHVTVGRDNKWAYTDATNVPLEALRARREREGNTETAYGDADRIRLAPDNLS